MQVLFRFQYRVGLFLFQKTEFNRHFNIIARSLVFKGACRFRLSEWDILAAQNTKQKYVDNANGKHLI